MKNFLKLLKNEFIYGGHLLSLGAVALLISGNFVFKTPINFFLMIISYSINQIVYNYNHLKESEKDFLTNPDRVEHLKKTERINLLLFFVYLLICAISLIYLKKLNLTILVLFILIGGILFTEFFKKLTKKIPLFKDIYVSIFWALGTFLIVFFYNIKNWLAIFLFFLFIFLRFLVSTIFFDIKDIESDKQEGLKTLPVIWGKKGTVDFLYFLNFFSFFPIIIGVYYYVFPPFSIFLCVFYFYTLYYLKKADQGNILKLSYIIVDGEYLFWPLLLFLAKLLNL